uniref:mevalonate kinase n=1 Tax=Inonotus obliquus TaxID=167356 RepID=A0A5C2I4F1_9AGAM|nr:mevalonate kinase [Inonotus obliquus]
MIRMINSRYEQTALAASVDLRCYGLTTPRKDNKVSVHFTDLGDYRHEWNIDDLPWDAATYIPPGSNHSDTLDPKLIDAISSQALPLSKHDVPTARNAALTFLYLYMTLAGDIRPALHFSARSTLPVGAGLGSSASFSSCAASALLLVLKRISVPPRPAPSIPPSGPEDPGHVHVSHQGRRALPTDVAEEINRWAFVAEKVLHGNPSGVDNCVSVFGGALAYTRPGFGRKSGMEAILGFKSLRFLLIDTKVPRNTKALVAGVALKKVNEPEYVGGLLEAIQSISDEAHRILVDTDLPREEQLRGLEVCS